MEMNEAKARLAAMSILSGMMPIKKEPSNGVKPYVMFHDGVHSVVVSTKPELTDEEITQNLYNLMKANRIDVPIPENVEAIRAYNNLIELPNDETMFEAFTKIEDGIVRSYLRAAEQTNSYDSVEEQMRREEDLRNKAGQRGMDPNAQIDQKIAIVKANQERFEDAMERGGFPGSFVGAVEEQVSGNLEAIEEQIREVRRRRTRIPEPSLN